MQSLRQSGRNQEMVVFTQGIYEARELALARMQGEAAQAGSSGSVGGGVPGRNSVWGATAHEVLPPGTARPARGAGTPPPRVSAEPPSPPRHSEPGMCLCDL